MAVYRFRITVEDNEDVYREIDIQGKQHFEDLHRAIQEAIGFDNSKDASFFISNDFWKKGQEIALNPPPADDDDDDDDRRNPKPKPKLMHKSKIVEYIDDPHQRLLYVFDPIAKWTFYVELIKIGTDEPKIMYPKCTRTVGAAPKQYKQVIIPPLDEDLDEEDAPKADPVFLAEEAYDGEENETDGEDGVTMVTEDPEEGGEKESEDDAEEASDFDPGEIAADEDF